MSFNLEVVRVPVGRRQIESRAVSVSGRAGVQYMRMHSNGDNKQSTSSRIACADRKYIRIRSNSGDREKTYYLLHQAVLVSL